jgi:alpha-tubulin suppressor-like RCC1 family protein
MWCKSFTSLTQSGEVYAWSNNYFGQIGCGDDCDKLVLTKLI